MAALPGGPRAGQVLLLLTELCILAVSAILTVCLAAPAILWQLLAAAVRACSRAPPRRFTSVLITGASGGIGRGLAVHYAAPGVRLVLVARRAEQLAAAAKECEDKGAEVVQCVGDVCDEPLMRRIIAEADAARGLDLVIANAGVIADREGFAGSSRVIDINVQGALHTVLPAIPRMRERRNGQIVFMSSLGSFAPPTNAYMMSYLASKAAINQFAGGMRAALGPHGVGVTVVTMGYVESEMTMSDLRPKGVDMPGLVSTADACQRIATGAAANDPVVFFPFWLYLITRVLGMLPGALRDMMLPLMVKNDPFCKVDALYAGK